MRISVAGDISYILVENNSIKLVKNVRIRRMADIYCNHYLLTKKNVNKEPDENKQEKALDNRN